MNYTEFAVQTAQECGKILMQYYNKPDLKFERKGYNDPATEADLASEKHAISQIRETFPDHAILAEESGKSDKESDYIWIIDPLDGTSNFKHGLPIFCVSIGLEYKGEIIAGAVYNPRIDEMFSAEKGKGAFLNNEPIKVTDRETKEFCAVATGFAPKPEIIEKNLPNFNNFMKEGFLIRRMGAAAIDLCYTACGHFDGFWEIGLSPWDIAAGSLIVKEAGGKVTQMDGDPLTMKSPTILATNGKLHETMMELL
ncbi:inositol monophosphatase family protein [Patescibacteria group bacterium]